MIVYLAVVGTIFLLFSSLFLLYKGLIFKNSKIRVLIRSDIFVYIIKKLIFLVLSMITIIIIIFILTELLVTNSKENIFTGLLKYMYKVLPFPKKICSTSYLENDNFVCSKYKYVLIDLGVSDSYIRNVSVIEIIKQKSIISFLIGILAYLLQCLIGYPLGIYLANKENNMVGKTFNAIHTIKVLIPSLIYFYIFVILFMVVFKLPVLFELETPLSYIAPIVAVTISSSLSVAYFIKKYIQIELNKDYVVMAKAKGLSQRNILYRHVLRNAMIPFYRTIPYSILACFSGYYILEATFNIPGIGQTLFYAIQLKDIALIRGTILFFSFTSIIAYLLGDAISALATHGVKYSWEEKLNERQNSL